MASQDLRLNIEVDDNGTLKIKNFGQAIQSTGKNAAGAGDKFNKLSAVFGGFQSKVESVFKSVFSLKGLLTTVLAGFSIYKMKQIVTGWIDLSGAQENAEKSLRQVMVSMGRYSDSLYQSMLNQASALQKLTGIGDEATIAGQKFLMTFKQIPDELMPRVTKSMLDLAALMGGGPGGVQRAALTMGKAAMGMTGELRRIGITVDADTFKMRGFGGVLEELEAQMRGQAEVMGTGYGLWTRYSSAVGDTKEQLGYFFDAIFTHTGLLKGLIENTEGMNASLEEFKKSGRLDEWAVSVAESTLDAAGWIIDAFSNVIDFVDTELIPRFGKIEDRIEDIKKASGYNTAQKVSGLMWQGLDWLWDDSAIFGAIKESIGMRSGKSGYLAFKNILGDPGENQNVLKEWQAGLSLVREGIKKLRDNIKLDLPEQPSSNTPTIAQLSGMHGHKTYMDYAKSIIFANDSLEEQNKIITAIKPNFTALADEGLKWFKQLEDQRKKWESISQTIGDSFTNALVNSLDDGLDSFKDFANDVKQLFLKLWMDKAITQPIIMPMVNQAAGMFGFGGVAGDATGGFSKAMGASAFGMTGGATYGQMLGAGAVGYGMGGIGGGIGATGGMLAGTKFLESSLGSFAGPVGAIAGGIMGSMLGEIFEKGGPSIEEVQNARIFKDIRTSLSEALAQGFIDTMQTGEYQTFKDSLKTSIKSIVIDALVSSFVSKAIEPLMDLLSPALVALTPGRVDMESIDWGKVLGIKGTTVNVAMRQKGIVRQMATPPGYIPPGLAGIANVTVPTIPVEPEAVISALPTSAELDNTLNSIIDILKPIIGLAGELADKLDLNTDAIGINTGAIMGPVNSYLMSLETGPLAPSQSLAGMVGMENKLFTAALADPLQFSAYTSYMTQSMLPFQQGISPDYAGLIEGEKARVNRIPWVTEARMNEFLGNPDVVNSIRGMETSMLKALLDIKETLQENDNAYIIVDGQLIKTQIIESLDDPDVVQKARSVI
jgi:hypothetical protein